jgi:hypothetical protein
MMPQNSTACRNLYECHGLFVPDPESTLFEEVAGKNDSVRDGSVQEGR